MARQSREGQPAGQLQLPPSTWPALWRHGPSPPLETEPRDESRFSWQPPHAAGWRFSWPQPHAAERRFSWQQPRAAAQQEEGRQERLSSWVRSATLWCCSLLFEQHGSSARQAPRCDSPLPSKPLRAGRPERSRLGGERATHRMLLVPSRVGFGWRGPAPCVPRRRQFAAPHAASMSSAPLASRMCCGTCGGRQSAERSRPGA